MLLLYIRDEVDRVFLPGCITRVGGSSYEFPIPDLYRSVFYQFSTLKNFKSIFPQFILYDPDADNVLFFNHKIEQFRFVIIYPKEQMFDIWAKKSIIYWSTKSHTIFPLKTQKKILTIYIILARLGLPYNIIEKCIIFANFACLKNATSGSELRRQQCQEYGCGFQC